MSLKEIQEDFNKILKPKLEEILELLKQIMSNENEKIEAVAAKIISELKTILQENLNNKEILEAIEQKDLRITPLETENKPKPIGLEKYSYPNHGVGNAELGSSGNPKALTWPFGKQ